MVVGRIIRRFAHLRAVAVGNVLSLSLEPNLNRRFSPFPRQVQTSALLIELTIASEIMVVGKDSKPSEVDDGRFTVCSLGRSGTLHHGYKLLCCLHSISGRIICAKASPLSAVASGNVLSLLPESNLKSMTQICSVSPYAITGNPTTG